MTDQPRLGQDAEARGLAVSLASAFLRRGEELYLVGGAVRDPLLGLTDYDLDFATSSLPDRTADILAGLAADRAYRTGERFGTIGIRIANRLVEITTYRSAEAYVEGSRKPDVRFGRSLWEDLRRRDFTINAMAYDPLTGELVDPFGGRADLANRILRAVGIAEERFSEDPLRLLRAIRFAARLDLAIDPDTRQALSSQAESLRRVSRERIRDEYSRILVGPHPAEGLTLLRSAGLLASSVPELLELTAMSDHGPRHPLSLWDHTMRVVTAVPAEITVRWAALLHDIAKPATRWVEPDGRPRFFHHEQVGSQTAREILRGLRYPHETVDGVALLVETHMNLHAYSPEWSDGAVRRLIVKIGPLLHSALALAKADAAAHGETGGRHTAHHDKLEERITALSHEPIDRLKSPLSGEDLMQRFSLPPGPWIRQVKEALLEAVMEGALDPGDMAAVCLLADELVQKLRGAP